MKINTTKTCTPIYIIAMCSDKPSGGGGGVGVDTNIDALTLV